VSQNIKWPLVTRLLVLPHQGIGRIFHASAKVMRLGGRIASVRMELINDADVLIATGTAAYVIS